MAGRPAASGGRAGAGESGELAAQLRAVERELAESRARLQAIADNTYDLILEMDEKGRVLAVDAGCRRLLAREPRDLIGRDVLEVVHPDDRKLVRRAFAAAMAEGRSVPGVGRMLRSDGAVVWLEGVAASYRDGDGAIRLLSCCRDVGERIRHQDAVQHAKEHFGRIFEASPAAMLVTRLEDGCVLSVNDSFLAMIGCERREILGPSPVVQDMWADPNERRVVIERLRATGSVRGFTAECRNKAGNATQGLISAEVIDLRGEKRIVWQCIDLSEQRAAQDALRASEERHRSLMEQSPLGIGALGRDFKVLHANPALAELIGAPSAEDLVGRDLRELPLYAVPGLRAAFERALTRGERGVSEVAYTSHWGKSVELRIRVAPFFDANGTVLGVQGIIEDVAERNRLERGARQAQRMEAAGQLASGVAHEFGNYLSVIAIYADLIRKAPGAAESPGRAAKIATVARLGSDLVARLQAFARKRGGALRVADLNASLRELDELIRGLSDHSIQVSTQLHAEPVCVRIDPAELDQIVVNLVLNARDAMPEGGTLSITTRRVRVAAGETPEGSPLAEGEYGVLSVRDTGAGMDSATRARIFEPFFTTKPPGRGTGLGLSLVHTAVERSGGSVRVTSQPGQGTRFEVYLPLAPDLLTERAGPLESRSGPAPPSS